MLYTFFVACDYTDKEVDSTPRRIKYCHDKAELFFTRLCCTPYGQKKEDIREDYESALARKYFHKYCAHVRHYKNMTLKKQSNAENKQMIKVMLTIFQWDYKDLTFLNNNR